MSLELHDIQVNNYTIRPEIHQGRPHIIIPAIMLRQGVLSGSHGPLLHLVEEYGKFVGAWNGIPVTVNHPQEDGMHVSANSPGVIDSQVVGRVYNAMIDGDKLKAEIWLDENAIQKLSPEILSSIRRHQILEVSVGVFTDDEMVSGDWNGTGYEAIARSHRPDHLSILWGNGVVGACSVEAGCGLRTNEKGGGDVKDKPIYTSLDEVMAAVLPPELLKELAGHGFGISVNQLSYGEVSQKIQAKLDRMDDDTKVHYLEETYPGFFIYRVRPRGGDMPMNPDGEALFKRSYTAQGDNSIEFTGEALPVVKKVDYVTANKEKGATSMSKDGKGPCCPEKVEALIANAETKWTPDDREVLLTMSAEQLEKLAPVVEVKTEKVEVPALMTQEQALQVLSAHLGDPDKAMALFPKEIREQLQDGLNLHRERRAGLIDRIITNQATPVYTKEKLEVRSMADLVELAQAISPKTDFTPLGGGNPNPAAYEAEILLPPGVV